MDTNYSAAEPTTAKSDKSDSSYDDYNDYDDYYDEDYILPDSGTRKLTNSDLAGLDADELELARNEIYARAGRRFNTDYIQDYLTINGGMWERLNPKISQRICSMMLKSIMLISFEIMRKIC